MAESVPGSQEGLCSMVLITYQKRSLPSLRSSSVCRKMTLTFRETTCNDSTYTCLPDCTMTVHKWCIGASLNNANQFVN
jgi:hypothetical protein